MQNKSLVLAALVALSQETGKVLVYENSVRTLEIKPKEYSPKPDHYPQERKSKGDKKRQRSEWDRNEKRGRK